MVDWTIAFRPVARQYVTEHDGGSCLPSWQLESRKRKRLEPHAFSGMPPSDLTSSH
jgi:hypothetical protein